VDVTKRYGRALFHDHWEIGSSGVMIAAVDIDGFWGLVERSAHETDTRQARVAG
jgi:hypothetical protein